MTITKTLNGGDDYGRAVGLAFVKKDKIMEKQLFYIFGHTQENPDDHINIDFSEIKNFKIIELGKGQENKNKVLVEIEQFPTITPEELLVKELSYTDLVNNFTKIIKLWITVYDNKKGELEIFSEIR